jgi:Fe2+ or Zn2+ uptake regulation protein
MSHDQINYSRILRDAGHRLTEQREVILEAVCQGGGHSTLKEIYSRANQANPSLDRSSVYRALKLFVELGIVVAGVNSDGEAIYEVAQPHPHHHLICRRCGEESAIDHTIIQALYTTMEHRYHFRVTSDHLVLFGFCEACDA